MATISPLGLSKDDAEYLFDQAADGGQLSLEGAAEFVANA